MVETASASTRTVKRRVQKVSELRDALGLSLADEVQALSKKKRAEELQGIGLPVQLPTDHSLAIKASLSMSWNKLRALRR